MHIQTDFSSTCLCFLFLRAGFLVLGEQKLSHLSELLDPAELQQTAGHDSGGTNRTQNLRILRHKPTVGYTYHL